MKPIDYKEAVRLIEEGETISRAERLSLQKQRLKTLVEYVRQNSP